jgi:hypothetical protein
VINFKISGIFAVTAFILSFLLSLLHGNPMPLLLFRPLIFALVFFIIPVVIKILASRFLPELLEDDSADFPGSKIDIIEGDVSADPREDAGGPQAAETPDSSFLGAQADESGDELGNISDLLPNSQAEARTGMDQDGQDEYNEGGLSQVGGNVPGNVPSDMLGSLPFANNGDLLGSVEMLPDLESMAGAFTRSSQDEDSDTAEYSATQKNSPRSKKTPEWTGDFKAKDIAKGIQTVLSKEKEG